MTIRTVEPVFDSAHTALSFALNFSGTPERPPMSKMAARSQGGIGLAGLDGAAQAGMIRAEIDSTGRLNSAILIARFAHRSTSCACKSACCSGKKANKEWVNAIATLADTVRTTALFGCTSDYKLRYGCVVMYFGGGITIKELTEQSDSHRDTVAAHLGRVRKYLKAEEERAQIAIDDRLKSAGIIA